MVCMASALRACGRSISRVATPPSISSRRSFMWSRPSAASAGTFQARLGHLAEVENFEQRRLGDAAGARQVTDRLPGAHRLLGDLGGFVVADKRSERGGEHRAALHQLLPAIGRL